MSQPDLDDAAIEVLADAPTGRMHDALDYAQRMAAAEGYGAVERDAQAGRLWLYRLTGALPLIVDLRRRLRISEQQVAAQNADLATASAELARVQAERDSLQQTVDDWAGLTAAHTYPPAPPPILTTTAGSQPGGWELPGRGQISCLGCGQPVWLEFADGLYYQDYHGQTLHVCTPTTERAP